MNVKNNILPLRADSMCFLDANFVLLEPEKLPQANQIPNKTLWITETTSAEIKQKQAERGMPQILPKNIKILSFNDLYSLDPRICPVYYYYILSMYNPANIGSTNFLQDAYESLLISGQVPNREQQRAYEQWRRQSQNGHMCDSSGNLKDNLLKTLEKGETRFIKKAHKSILDGHPSLLRDIRTLSLVIYSALSSKRDTILFTTDCDHTHLFLKWWESMTMRLAFINLAARRLHKAERKKLYNYDIVKLIVNYSIFTNIRHELFIDGVLDTWKTSGVTITIRTWNQVQQTFEEDIWLTFPDDLAELLSNLHGNLWCYFTRNDNYFNWLRFKYNWPPSDNHSEDVLFEISMKHKINRTSSRVLLHEHDNRCKYRTDDMSGALATWSDFLK